MTMVTQTKHKENKEKKKLVGTRGRSFHGFVVKKFEHRVVVEFVRIVRVPKYERFAKEKTRLHARIPDGMKINLGDYVKVKETRPLSKIVHFLVTDIVKAKGEVK